MNEQNENLIVDFKKSIFENNTNIISDFAEAGMDAFLSDGIIKDIPIINSLKTLSVSIFNYNAMKKTYIFLKELNSNTIDKNKLNAHKEKLENDKKYAKKELERVLLLLNKFIDDEKAIMLAKLYKALINQEINWNEFSMFSEIVDRLFIEDIELLKSIYLNSFDITLNKLNEFKWFDEEYKLNRLYAVGLIKLNPKYGFTYGMTEAKEFMIEKNLFAEKFVNIVLK